MKLTWKHAVLALAAFCGVVAVVVLSFFFLTASGSQGSRVLFPGSARQCILDWGRLAPFPASAGTVSPTTEGGAFARAFRARFQAPAADIERWLQASPGIGDATLDAAKGIRHYEIKPGKGAAQAEVNVNDSTHEVAIYVCWS